LAGLKKLISEQDVKNNDLKKGLFLLFVALAIFSSACSVSRATRSSLYHNPNIVKDSKIYIMGIDGSYKKQQNSDRESAMVLIAAIRSLLMTHGFRSYVGKTLDLEKAILDAATMQCNYVLKATVTEWGENAPPWSGNQDSYGLSIELYGVPHGNIVGFATHRVVGPKWTGFRHHPDRFIPEAADHSLSAIFRWSPMIFANQ